MTRVTLNEMRNAAKLVLDVAEQRYVESDGQTLNRKQLKADANGTPHSIQREAAEAFNQLGPLAKASHLRSMTENVFEHSEVKKMLETHHNTVANERLIPFQASTEADKLTKLGRVFFQLAALIQSGDVKGQGQGPTDRPDWMDAEVVTRAPPTRRVPDDS